LVVAAGIGVTASIVPYGFDADFGRVKLAWWDSSVLAEF